MSRRRRPVRKTHRHTVHGSRRYRYDNRRHGRRHSGGNQALYTLVIWITVIVAIGSGAVQVTGK